LATDTDIPKFAYSYMLGNILKYILVKVDVDCLHPQIRAAN